MRRLIHSIDRLAHALAALAGLAIVVLVVAMLYEVFARYALGAPTLWAFDIAYMLNGSLFLLGAALTLRQDAHVRIDFLAQRLPAPVRRAIEVSALLGAMLPLFAWISLIAVQKAWKAWVSGQVDAVSPWAPLVWPFYTALAVGLVAFTLQLLTEGLRHAAGLPQERPETAHG